MYSLKLRFIRNSLRIFFVFNVLYTLEVNKMAYTL